MVAVVRNRGAHLDEVKAQGNTALVLMLDVPLEIHVEELEYEVKFRIGMDDVEQPG